MVIQAVRRFKVLPLFLALLSGCWICSQAAWALSISRIIPEGRVEAYRGDRVVQVYTQEGPFPEGYLLKTQGRCGVRLNDFYLVADDQSVFGIHHQNGERVLTIEEGMVYFALSNMPGDLVFQTPDGIFPARQIVIHASADQGVLKAYLDVQPNQTQIGVLEGGYMVVSTIEGDRKIEPGRQITVAQALLFEDEDQEEPGAAEDKQPASEEAEKAAKQDEKKTEQIARKSNTGVYVGVGLAAVAVIGAALALGGGGGGSSSGGDGGGGGGNGGNGSVSPVD